MKKLCLFLLFITWGLSSVSAQADFAFMLNKEGKIVALPKFTKFEFNIPELSYKSYTPSSTRMTDDLLKSYQPQETTNFDERPMDMQVLSGAYKPFYEEYAPMLRRVSPTAFDFREVEFIPLNENLAFAVTGQQQTWPGMGGITSVSPSLVWQSGPWQVDGGAFAARYFTPFNQSPELVLGANLHGSYQMTDWLKLHGWGQYAGYDSNERRNPHMLLSPYYNHNSIGGAFEFKLNEDFGVGAGLQYEFNPMRNKWERQILLFPVFH